MKDLEKEFVPHELALRMKEIGFDEPCLGSFTKKGNFERSSSDYLDNSKLNILSDYFGKNSYYCLAPTWQSAFRWFRDNHGWIGSVWQCGISKEGVTSFEYVIDKLNDLGVSQYRQNFPYKTYEEAELACLEGLIEIIEQEKK